MRLLCAQCFLSVAGAKVPAVKCCMHFVGYVLFQSGMIWTADLSSSHPGASDLGRRLQVVQGLKPRARLVPSQDFFLKKRGSHRLDRAASGQECQWYSLCSLAFLQWGLQ